MNASLLFQHTLGKNDGRVCEDAFASDPPRGRFAVADGVTRESLLSGYFAQRLVDVFLGADNATLDHFFGVAAQTPPAGPIPGRGDGGGAVGGEDPLAGLDPFASLIRDAWQRDVTSVYTKNLDDRNRRDWQEAKLASHATFAGVRVRPGTDGGYDLDVAVVGDCFAFLCDPRKGLRVVTMAATGDGPVVHDTASVRVGNDTRAVFAGITRTTLQVSAGTYVVLATDWIGRRLHKLFGGAKETSGVLADLMKYRARSEFVSWIWSCRTQPDDSDDVALLMACLNPGATPGSTPGPPPAGVIGFGGLVTKPSPPPTSDPGVRAMATISGASDDPSRSTPPALPLSTLPSAPPPAIDPENSEFFRFARQLRKNNPDLWPRVRALQVHGIRVELDPSLPVAEVVRATPAAAPAEVAMIVPSSPRIDSASSRQPARAGARQDRPIPAGNFAAAYADPAVLRYAVIGLTAVCTILMVLVVGRAL